MPDATAKITLDDIVAAAGAGAVRAMDSRRLSDEKVSMEKLVGSGFGVHISVWAGGIFGPWGPYGPYDGGGGLPGGRQGAGAPK